MPHEPLEASIYAHLKGEYALFREIVEGLGDMVFVKDLEGHYLSVNSAFADRVGRPKEDIIGNNDRQILGDRAADQISRHERELLLNGNSVEYELRYEQSSKPSLFLCRKYLLSNSLGTPIAIVGLSRDVTSERLAQNKYRFIFDNAPIAFWEEDFSEVKVVFDELRSKGVKDFRVHFEKQPADLKRCIEAIRITDVNLATLRMNRTLDKPRLISDLKRKFTLDSTSVFLEEFLALAEGRTFYQSEASTIEVGEDRLDVLFNLNVLPGHEEDLSLVLVSVIDVTQIKQAEVQLSQMKELYRSVVEGQQEMICRFLPSGKVTFFNAAFKNFFWPRIEHQSEFTFQQLFPDTGWNDRGQQLLDLTPIEPSCTFEAHNYDEDGRIVWQHWSIIALFDRTGAVSKHQAVGSDVTERKETEAQLAASEERWRSVFENAEDIIMTMNASGLILSANRPAIESYGQKIAGKLLTEVLTKETAERTNDALKQVFEAGDRVEMELKMTGGALRGRVLSCVFTPIFQGERVLSATLIARDVTENRRLENRIREALIEGQEQERKRVSRELHDGLGQLFTALKLNMQHLKAGIKNEEQENALARLELLEHNIGVAINEVKYISHNLMPEVLEQFGLQPALHDLVNSWSRSEGNTTVTLGMVNLDHEPPAHMALALFRIAQELITNAVRHSEAKKVFLQVIDHGTSIMLTVEDDGKGFDPMKESVGLGLRNIRSRTELLEGMVDIDSTPGKGTMTTVEIPYRSSAR